MTNVLVVFATKHGSTQQVANTIVTALSRDDVTAQSRPAAQVPEPLRDWDLVILGGALYSGRWHRDAHRFLKRHRRELGTVPIAVFGMGPRTDDEAAWRHSRRQLDRALAKRAWLSPLAVTVFGGVDPPRRGDRVRRDLRDGDVIRRWAGSVLARVRGDRPPPEPA
ncbi:flavodoxin domain-containing protein [Amycolatopsis sp. NPDC021455]|uniref:flavodoxin domain-containing protein n=1 Tax=Amycolatopsis sp. NPDC021455 TaxID=3154901 RepID=UPI0033F816CC